LCQKINSQLASTLIFDTSGIEAYVTENNPKFLNALINTYYINGKCICICENPCTSSPSGRIVYTYPYQDLRTYHGIIRDSNEWNTLYNLRGKVEQTIQYFKDPMAVSSPKTRDRLTIKADAYLVGVTQLITVILADLLNKPEYFKSLRSLIA